MVKGNYSYSRVKTRVYNDPKNKQRNKAEKGGDLKVTMFEQLWYGTAKILTLGPSPLLIFEAQVPSLNGGCERF